MDEEESSHGWLQDAGPEELEGGRGDKWRWGRLQEKQAWEAQSGLSLRCPLTRSRRDAREATGTDTSTVQGSGTAGDRNLGIISIEMLLRA